VKTINAGPEMYPGLEKQIVGIAGFEGHEVTRILQERRVATREGRGPGEAGGGFGILVWKKNCIRSLTSAER
jgi:hypothetical protein